MDENELLNLELEKASSEPKNDDQDRSGRTPDPSDEMPSSRVAYVQWEVGPNDSYRPTGATVDKIPPAVYRFNSDNRGLYLEKMNVVTDDLIVLPDSANDRVLSGMEKFWNSKERYKTHGLLYKRGVFLWGPAGSGKTASLQLMMKQLISKGGIVIFSEHPEMTVMGLPAVRRIEPDRNIIVILEDVDETVARYGEHALLAILDGEHQIPNVVNVACPAPETRILKADLTWARADSLQSGDTLIAFDEHGPQRKYRTATVKSCPLISKTRYRIITDKSTIIVSVDHPFLTKNGRTKHGQKWRYSQDLKPGHLICFIGEPWDTENTRDGGYLAGQYDAEGSLNFSWNQHNSMSFRVPWGQVIGGLSDKMRELLLARGFDVSVFVKHLVMGRVGLGVGHLGPHKPQISLTVNGGKWQNLRLLGSIRPIRLLADERLPLAWEGNRLSPKYAEVISVDEIGDGPVVALDTSTKTFIGEGLLQHNTSNYPDRLGARILNRPSRFDERILVDMPTAQAREIYLRSKVGTSISDEELAKWVADTDKMSVAHLRELSAAVLCLDQDYSEVIKRLKAMAVRPKETREMGHESVGFTLKGLAATGSQAPSIRQRDTDRIFLG